MKKEARIFNRVFRQWNPSAQLPKIEIRYYPYTTLTHTIRFRHGAIKIRLSHLFQDAPARVLESIGQILFSKLYQHRSPAEALNRYHRYVEANQQRFRILAKHRGQSKPTRHHFTGHHQDLSRVFARVNRRYFASAMTKPVLAWSHRGLRSKLGEYQSLHHAIVINRRFDNPQTPSYVLDYLMFHEMLHIKHNIEIRNGRRVVHTAQFRSEERVFK